jgi:hypothetical protein
MNDRSSPVASEERICPLGGFGTKSLGIRRDWLKPSSYGAYPIGIVGGISQPVKGYATIGQNVSHFLCTLMLPVCVSLCNPFCCNHLGSGRDIEHGKLLAKL